MRRYTVVASATLGALPRTPLTSPVNIRGAAPHPANIGGIRNMLGGGLPKRHHFSDILGAPTYIGRNPEDVRWWQSGCGRG